MNEEARARRLEETWERYEAGQPARDDYEAAAYQRWAQLQAAPTAEDLEEAALEARAERGYEAG